MRHYALALAVVCLAASIVWSSTPSARASESGVKCVNVAGMKAANREALLEPLVGLNTVIVMEDSAMTSIVCGW